MVLALGLGLVFGGERTEGGREREVVCLRDWGDDALRARKDFLRRLVDGDAVVDDSLDGLWERVGLDSAIDHVCCL